GHTNFLHDGRARNIQEAILWHGGEAAASVQYFYNLSRQDRNDLLKFLSNL
ncbi:MAG TPA: di-heme oxidoredictase family protein, partial [Bacteroidia bacterium]|nr:di-heme oxidoredictase family protein [Bacteroidia bacterium]